MTWTVLWLLTLLVMSAPVSHADDLLARITAHTLQELNRLPDCTCLETLLREHKQPDDKGPLRPLDTVRFEVLYSRGHELYASPDGQRWEENPAAFPAAGLVGTGPFALYLRAIFAVGETTFSSRGNERLDGRPALRYDFQIPRSMNIHHIKVPGGDGMVGIKGSFWADPVTLDLLRLEASAVEIPPELPVDFYKTSIHYERVRIGGRDVVLPQSGDLHMLEASGEENRDTLEFTHCRSFHTESTVSFGPVPSVPPDRPPAAFSATVLSHPKTDETLPPGLDVTVALTTPVSEKSVVGTAIEGRVTHDVRSHGELLIPRNAVARGRIRRIDRFSDRSGDYLVVALEFIEIETTGSVVRFFADLTDVQRLPGLDLRWSTSHRSATFVRNQRVVTTQQSFLPNLPGVGAFFIRAPYFTLPKGLDFFWKTRALGQ
jgi:hypothetical protein